MAFKKSLLLLAVAGVFLVHPMTADASSISLALAGGISSSLDDSSATDEDVEAVVAQTAKENYTGALLRSMIMLMSAAKPAKRGRSLVNCSIILSVM